MFRHGIEVKRIECVHGWKREGEAGYRTECQDNPDMHTGYDINDGYTDNDNYGALRLVRPGAEEWNLVKPNVEGPRILTNAQLSSGLEGDFNLDFIELDIAGISQPLSDGLKFQKIFFDEKLKLVRPQLDEKGMLLPPYAK